MDIRRQLREWYKGIPNLNKGALRRRWVKALQRKGTTFAIGAKCCDCMGFQRTGIRKCGIVTCPLWQYRPSRDKNGKIEAEVTAIAKEIEEEATSDFVRG